MEVTMAQSAKKSRPVATFKHPVTVEVYRPEFEVFASVKHLDAAKLARAASAEVEVGSIKNSCCPQMVRAVIKKGLVTGLAIDSCPESKLERPSAEIVRLLNLAQRRASKPGSRPPRFPIPVATFMRQAATISTDTITLTCVSICIHGACILCCKNEKTGDWACSTKGIVVKPPSP
jgi:hypothetical protein